MTPLTSTTTIASPTACTTCSKSIAAMVAGPSHHADGVEGRDPVGAVAQFREHLVGVLAEQRRPGDLGLQVGELDRAADRQVLAALLVVDLDDGAALAQ